MNIQIFGTTKCFDTKKAQRYFQERRIKFQFIDILKYGMSDGEFTSVLRAVGGIDNLVNWASKSPDVSLLKYLAGPRQKEEKVLENPKLLKTPVVRNGKQATVGYCPEVWAAWE